MEPSTFRDDESLSDPTVELNPFMTNPFLEDEPEPTTTNPLPHLAKPVTDDVKEESPTSSAQPRQSSRATKPVDRIVMSKASGYSSIKRYSYALIQCLTIFKSPSCV